MCLDYVPATELATDSASICFKEKENDVVVFPTVYTLPQFDALTKKALLSKDPKQTRDVYAVYHSIVVTLHNDCIEKGYLSDKYRYLPRNAVPSIFAKLFNTYPFLMDDCIKTVVCDTLYLKKANNF